MSYCNAATELELLRLNRNVLKAAVIKEKVGDTFSISTQDLVKIYDIAIAFGEETVRHQKNTDDLLQAVVEFGFEQGACEHKLDKKAKNTLDRFMEICNKISAEREEAKETEDEKQSMQMSFEYCKKYDLPICPECAKVMAATLKGRIAVFGIEEPAAQKPQMLSLSPSSLDEHYHAVLTLLANNKQTTIKLCNLNWT